MTHPIPSPHAPVALRSQSKLNRMLLFIALAAVVALTAAVVILTNDNDQATSASKASPAVQQQPQTAPGVRFDGGPDEGTRGLAAQRQLPVGTRFDGGPDEGSRGATSYYDSPLQRSSYQPAPADSFKDRAGGPRMIPQGPAGN